MTFKTRMSTNIDTGHKALVGIIDRYGSLRLSDANEAETRLKVIDEVLRTVLGWTLDDMTVEQRVVGDGNVEYADYIIRTATTAIVVEAKRVGATFTLPGSRKTLKLGGVLSEGEIGAAIRQARDYCRELAIPFAVVTNGACWIVFCAVRTDGVPFRDDQARVFRSLDDIKERLVEFWELLSRQRVIEGNLEHEFYGSKPTELKSRCVRQLLIEPGFRLGRNSLYEHIEPAVMAAFSDEALLQDAEALRECYIKTTERVKFDERIQMHLRDVRPPLGHKTTRVRSRKNSSTFDERVVDTRTHSGDAPRPTRFIVLLGPVGAGKTTFLHHTRYVSSANQIDGQIIWLYLDFKKATPQDSARSFMYREVLTLIENDEDFGLGDWNQSIRHAYKPQIDSLRRGPLYLLSKRDPAAFELKVGEFISRERDQIEPYVDRILKWAGTKWPAFLIVDNVDQIDDTSMQARIFVEAQAMARRAGLHVIISLREATYLEHRNSPALDAFQFESFYVDPPSVLPVLSRRFAYVRKVIEGRRATLETQGGVAVSVSDLSRFFSVVSSSLLSDPTGYMIEVLSGNDIRRGLNLVREFMSSGHTTADRALSTFLSGGEYRFPEHEVLRAVVLGQRKYYNDAVSLIPNLYDAKLGHSLAQLLRLQIVRRLVDGATREGFEGEVVSELVEELHRVGIAEPDVLSVILRLQEAKIVTTADGQVRASSSSRLMPTRLAGYMLRHLCHRFAYTEFCLLDTVIFDDDAWNELESLTMEIEGSQAIVEKIQLRLRRIRSFMEYVKRQEERWIVECKRRHLEDGWGHPVITQAFLAALDDELDRVEKSARRNYS